MNDYFIDTFELTYKASFDEIRQLTKHMDFFKVKDKKYYICNDRSTMGFMLKSTPCSRGERYNENKKHKLVIRVDPDRVFRKGIKDKHIYDIETFDHMIEYMDTLLEYWFKDISLNDFQLTRIDITKDIHDIPEPIIREYIMLMRQMPLYSGFKLKKYYRMPDGYLPENSFEVWNNESRLEFVVYNKHHEVMSKTKYSDEDKEYYKNTMRLEVRCNRRYFKNQTKDLTTKEALMKIFRIREHIAEDTFRSVFHYFEDVCFLAPYWQKKYISKYNSNKTAKAAKMLWLSEKMNDKSRPAFESILELYPKSYDAKINLIRYFEDMGLSPIPILNRDIPYLQSVSSILGFSTVSTRDEKYYRMISARSTKKLFIYESNRKHSGNA